MLVAITGNMASGKSTFLRMLSEYGAEIFDADMFVDLLYKKKEIIEKIKKEFGEETVNGSAVDKKALAEIAFNDPKQLVKLNSIIHPLIREELKNIHHEGRIVLAEIPLLFEAQMNDLFDKIILVRCLQEVALKRAVKKGFSEQDFKKRIKFQWQDEKKLPYSDFIVTSNCTIDELRLEARKISNKLVEISAAKS